MWRKQDSGKESEYWDKKLMSFTVSSKKKLVGEWKDKVKEEISRETNIEIFEAIFWMERWVMGWVMENDGGLILCRDPGVSSM